MRWGSALWTVPGALAACLWVGAEAGQFLPLLTEAPNALQARLCSNMQKARELWDSIMTKGNAKFANMWLEYYNLER